MPPAHFNELCRTPEPNYADVHAAIYPVDKCLFKEGGEPRASDSPSLHALQLLPDSSELARYPGNGGGCYRSRMEFGGNRKISRLTCLFGSPYLFSIFVDIKVCPTGRSQICSSRRKPSMNNLFAFLLQKFNCRY